MEILDYILLPFYTLLLFAFVNKYAKKHTPLALQRPFYTAFWLRIFGCIAYTMVTQYYYGYGDTLTYFVGSKIYTEQILKDVSNIQYLFSSLTDLADWYNLNYDSQLFGDYFTQPTGSVVMRISAILSFFSFNKILIISLFFALFSFAGQWKLFLIFDELNGYRNRKLLAFATLYTPSIWFWGSGLMKDSICLGALGFAVSILYKIFVKKKGFSFAKLIMLFVMLWLLAQIKSYIFAILMLGIGSFMVKKVMMKIKGVPAKLVFLTLALLFIFGIIASIDIQQQVDNLVEETIITRNAMKNDYERAAAEGGSKGGFSASDLNPTLGGIIANSPATILSCLYRPFLWESRSIMILLTSLESTILLLFTMYLILKSKFFGFFKQIFQNPYIIFCFWMSIFFALIIGFTTFNFGTMVRYKIIFLPFFYFLHVYIYSNFSKPKAQTISS